MCTAKPCIPPSKCSRGYPPSAESRAWSCACMQVCSAPCRTVQEILPAAWLSAISRRHCERQTHSKEQRALHRRTLLHPMPADPGRALRRAPCGSGRPLWVCPSKLLVLFLGRRLLAAPRLVEAAGSGKHHTWTAPSASRSPCCVACSRRDELFRQTVPVSRPICSRTS